MTVDGIEERRRGMKEKAQKPVSKYDIQLVCGECPGSRKTGRPNPSREINVLRHER